MSTTGGMRTTFSRYVVCKLTLRGCTPFRGVHHRETEVLSTELGKRAAPASISHPWKKRRIEEHSLPGTAKEPLAPSDMDRVNMEIGIRYGLISFSPDSVSYSTSLLSRLREPPMPALILSSALTLGGNGSLKLDLMLKLEAFTRGIVTEYARNPSSLGGITVIAFKPSMRWVFCKINVSNLPQSILQCWRSAQR